MPLDVGGPRSDAADVHGAAAAAPAADAAEEAGAGRGSEAGGADAEQDLCKRKHGEAVNDWVTRVNRIRFPSRQKAVEEELKKRSRSPQRRRASELGEDKLSKLDHAALSSYMSRSRKGAIYLPLDQSEQHWLVLELRRLQGDSDVCPKIAAIRIMLSKGRREGHLGAHVQEGQLQNFYRNFCSAAAGQRTAARDVAT